MSGPRTQRGTMGEARQMPEQSVENATLRIAADVGGTFTDLAVFDEATGRIRLGKTLTTPARLIEGMSTGLTKAGASFDAGQLSSKLLPPNKSNLNGCFGWNCQSRAERSIPTA